MTVVEIINTTSEEPMIYFYEYGEHGPEATRGRRIAYIGDTNSWIVNDAGGWTRVDNIIEKQQNELVGEEDIDRSADRFKNLGT